MENKRKGGPVTKENKSLILEDITNIIKTGEINSMNYAKLAKKYEVSRQTIKKYLEEIKDLIEPEEIYKTYINLESIYDKLEIELEETLEKSITSDEKRKTIDTYLSYMRERTDFLERFNMIPKIE